MLLLLLLFLLLLLLLLFLIEVVVVDVAAAAVTTLYDHQGQQHDMYNTHPDKGRFLVSNQWLGVCRMSWLWLPGVVRAFDPEGLQS